MNLQRLVIIFPNHFKKMLYCLIYLPKEEGMSRPKEFREQNPYNTYQTHNPYQAPQSDYDDMYEEYEYDDTPFYKMSGRIGRWRYIAYSGLMSFLPIAILGILAAIIIPTLPRLPSSFDMSIFFIFIAIFLLLMMYGVIASAKRRFNDLNRSGWWTLLFMVPFLNLLVWLYLMLAAGEERINDYGAPAAPPSLRVIVVACIFLLLMFGNFIFSMFFNSALN